MYLCFGCEILNVKCSYSFPIEDELPGKKSFVSTWCSLDIGVTRALRFPMVIIESFTNVFVFHFQIVTVCLSCCKKAVECYIMSFRYIFRSIQTMSHGNYFPFFCIYLLCIALYVGMVLNNKL